MNREPVHNLKMNDYRLYCPKCHYDLTGNQSHICPECGHRFNPQLLKNYASKPHRSHLLGAVISAMIPPFVGLIALYYALKTIHANQTNNYTQAAFASAKARRLTFICAAISMLFLFTFPWILGLAAIIYNALQ